MSDPSPEDEKVVHIDREELSFLIVLCSEEADRAEYERHNRPDMSNAEYALSMKRENLCLSLLKILTSVLNKCDETDGVEGRPELN